MSKSAEAIQLVLEAITKAQLLVATENPQLFEDLDAMAAPLNNYLVEDESEEEEEPDNEE